jgi:hypothetical protein
VDHAAVVARLVEPDLALLLEDDGVEVAQRVGGGEADDAAADDRYVVATAVAVLWDVASSRFAGMTRISS